MTVHCMHQMHTRTGLDTTFTADFGFTYGYEEGLRPILGRKNAAVTARTPAMAVDSSGNQKAEV
eukprot:2633687-Pyramimonas_sp.AAC.2